MTPASTGACIPSRLVLRLLGTLVAIPLLAAPAARGASLEVATGPSRALVTDAPWSLDVAQRGGETLRGERGLAYRDAAGLHRALDATVLRRDGDAVTATVRTDALPLRVRVAPAGDGVVRIEVVAPVGALATRAEFAAPATERFYGFGERSDAVERGGREALNLVADGPYRREDRQFTKASVPPWAQSDRDDATYFPVPWLLSSRGYGVAIEEDATSRFEPGAPRWAAEADGGRLRLLVFAGPSPAAALARFTARTGRQPAPQAPWTFGPWFQTGQPNVVPVEEERAITKAQRDAGAPVSVAETQMHYLPCGAQRGREAAERERTDSFHRDGLARLVYFNPLLCVSYREVYDRAAAAGVLQKGPSGTPFSYPAFVGGSGPAGFTQEPLAQFDFTNPGTADFYAGLVDEAVRTGVDGWMEDFGESTPPVVTQADGSTGSAAHNRYPTDYHCALQRIAARYGRPLVRFMRSGWTGTARCAEVVWGGDPTTVWGFDGLRSAVTQLLSMGLSGIARWGTDIGGYNSFGAALKPDGLGEDETLTPELLTRWIELGALVPVMRTKRSGIAIPSYARPQVYDRAILPVWRSMTQLHTRLNPYLRASDEAYRATGLPIARHLVLIHPTLARAQAAEDEYLLGPDLLAAPVTAPGARERKLWLPPGRWVDWWRPAAGTLAGNRDVTLPAPLGRPPLLARAGALVPLLEPDVETLTLYGRDAGLTRYADRRDHLRILAFPRGRSSARLPEGGSARSTESRGRWTLKLRNPRRTRWTVEASLASLKRPFAPRRVLVGGREASRKRWRYDRRTRTLTVVAKGASVRIDAS
jgi:alpha-glucosidase (family GH31 glycosyl hydrolase)